MKIEELIRQYSKQRFNYEINNNCNVDTINKRSANWVARLGLAHGIIYKKYLKINTGLFAYFTYPSSDPNAQKIVQLGSDLISWLFLFDDEHGEGRVQVGENNFLEKKKLIEKLNTYRDLLEHDILPNKPSPFHISMQDFLARVDELNPDKNWRKRFSKAMDDYFDGCIEEYDYRRGLKELDLDTYFKLRSKSIGAYPVFELITLYQDSNPFNTGKNYDFKLLEKYRYHSALLCSWVNDIFSLEKELTEKESNNLVMLIYKKLGLRDYEQARIKSFEFNKNDLKKLDEIIYIYQNIEEMDISLKNYLNRMRCWTIGNLYWTICSGRYKIELDNISELYQLINNLNIPFKAKDAIFKSI